jgi:hypothetical protein
MPRSRFGTEITHYRMATGQALAGGRRPLAARKRTTSES